MNPLGQKTLGLFLTRGVSLADWHASGILSREIAVYNRLADYFREVKIFTYGGNEDLGYSSYLAPNIKVYPLRNRMPKFIKMFFISLRHASELRKCDWLKTNQMFGAFGAIVAGALYGKPVIIRTGYTLTKFLEKESITAWRKILGRLEEKSAYRRGSLFIVSSKHDFEYVCSKYGTDPGRGLVVPNYIDTEAFRPLGLLKERDLIFVGRLAAQKNLYSLLEAMKGTGLSATFVGQGELEGGLKARAVSLRLDIKWLPRVKNSDLGSLIDSHRIFALVSHYEGMPKSLLEAMACGVAVLGADSEGINEVIEDGKDGILCGTTSDSIHAGLLRLIADENLRVRLGTAARLKIEAQYSLPSLIEKETSFYRQMFCSGVDPARKSK